jgi:hypothetical protein
MDQQVVYKFKLTTGTTGIVVPEGSKTLSVQMQGNFPTLWMLTPVGVDTKMKTRRFEILATGEVVAYRNRNFIGTVQTPAGYVWHIFELLD